MERAAKEVVKDVKQAVKGGPQAPTPPAPPAPPKSAPKEVKAAVREAPKVLNQDVLDKVRAAGMHSCILCYASLSGECMVSWCTLWPLGVNAETCGFL